MSVQATFSATLVDEWVRLGVTDAVVCPGRARRRSPWPLAHACGSTSASTNGAPRFYALGLAKATGRPVVVCVTSGTAAAELHAAVVEAHHARVPAHRLHGGPAARAAPHGRVADDRAGRALHGGDPLGGRPRRAVGGAGGDLATARGAGLRGGDCTARRVPGPVHLNLAFREPLTGDAGAPPGAPRADRRRERAAAGPAPIEPLARSRLLIVGGGPSRPRRSHARCSGLERAAGLARAGRSALGCRVAGTIAAADAIVRTGAAPARDGRAPRRTLALQGAGRVRRRAPRRGARVVVVDPWRQRPDPSRVATEFDHATRTRGWPTAAERAEPGDPAWLRSWRPWKPAQEAIDERAGHRAQRAAGGPDAATAMPRRVGATVFVSASMPIRDLEWYARGTAVRRRGCWPTGAPTGSTASSRRRSVSPRPRTRAATLALLGDLAFLHDVSGLVNVPAVPARSSSSTTAGGGSSRSSRRRRRSSTEVFEPLFGTPPASDLGAVARGFGLPVEEVTKLSELEAALAGAAGAGRDPGPGAGASGERRPARRDQPGGPSRAGAEGRRRGRASSADRWGSGRSARRWRHPRASSPSRARSGGAGRTARRGWTGPSRRRSSSAGRGARR